MARRCPAMGIKIRFRSGPSQGAALVQLFAFAANVPLWSADGIIS